MKKIVWIFLLISSLIFANSNNYSIEKVVSQNGTKYQAEIRVELIDEKLPTEKQLKDILLEIKSENTANKNFFIYAGLPIKENSKELIYLYKISQMGNEDIIIDSLRANVEFSKMKINNEYKNKIGAINYNCLIPLKKGIEIKEIIGKYGEPFNLSDETYSYLLLSKTNKIIATLYLETKDNKVVEYSTFSMDDSINQKELISLLEGKIKSPKLNAKQLK